MIMGATKTATDASKGIPATELANLENYALSKLPAAGILKMRMAGQKADDIGPLTSLAEESEKQKYSDGAYSKSPSGYLAASAKPLTSRVA